MPKPGEIFITFDERKIEAMTKFPIDAEATYEEEILAAVEAIYKRRVPDAVRYLLGEEEALTVKKRRKAGVKQSQNIAEDECHLECHSD